MDRASRAVVGSTSWPADERGGSRAAAREVGVLPLALEDVALAAEATGFAFDGTCADRRGSLAGRVGCGAARESPALVWSHAGAATEALLEGRSGARC